MAERIFCARPPSKTGIKILSKSLRGKSSINIPVHAIIKAVLQSLQVNEHEIKIAVKQVRLPATVFP